VGGRTSQGAVNLDPAQLRGGHRMLVSKGAVVPGHNQAAQPPLPAPSSPLHPRTATHPHQTTLPPPPPPAVICTGSQDRTAKVWRLPSLVPALTLKGHRRGIWAVAFSPVDQAVATASGASLRAPPMPACLQGFACRDATPDASPGWSMKRLRSALF
jgi:WD40 repeat protein